MPSDIFGRGPSCGQASIFRMLVLFLSSFSICPLISPSMPGSLHHPLLGLYKALPTPLLQTVPICFALFVLPIAPRQQVIPPQSPLYPRPPTRLRRNTRLNAALPCQPYSSAFSRRSSRGLPASRLPERLLIYDPVAVFSSLAVALALSPSSLCPLAVACPSSRRPPPRNGPLALALLPYPPAALTAQADHHTTLDAIFARLFFRTGQFRHRNRENSEIRPRNGVSRLVPPVDELHGRRTRSRADIVLLEQQESIRFQSVTRGRMRGARRG